MPTGCVKEIYLALFQVHYASVRALRAWQSHGTADYLVDPCSPSRRAEPVARISANTDTSYNDNDAKKNRTDDYLKIWNARAQVGADDAIDR